MKALLTRNAEELRRLHARVHETAAQRDLSAAHQAQWETACAQFHARWDRLAFPGGYDGAHERILAGDRTTIEAALCFVELRPYFFCSGYMLKELLQKLKRAALGDADSKRLQAVLDARVAWRKAQREGRA